MKYRISRWKREFSAWRRKHTVKGALAYWAEQRNWSQNLILWVYFKIQYIKSSKQDRVLMNIADEVINEIKADEKSNKIAILEIELRLGIK